MITIYLRSNVFSHFLKKTAEQLVVSNTLLQKASCNTKYIHNFTLAYRYFCTQLYFMLLYHTYALDYLQQCQPRWSRGNVLPSRSKVREFKPGWGRWIFSGRNNPPGGTFSGGSRVWDFRLVKEPQAWKIDLWAKFNRHIHVVVSKFGEHNRSGKCRSALGSNDHSINTIQYNSKTIIICLMLAPVEPAHDPLCVLLFIHRLLSLIFLFVHSLYFKVFSYEYHCFQFSAWISYIHPFAILVVDQTN